MEAETEKKGKEFGFWGRREREREREREKKKKKKLDQNLSCR